MPHITDTPELRRAIARAVLDDLEDRRHIRRWFMDLRLFDPEIYAEIENTIAAKVMRVLEAASPTAEDEAYARHGGRPETVDRVVHSFGGDAVEVTNRPADNDTACQR